MSNTPALNADQSAQRDAFVDRVLQSAAGAFEIFSLHIGHKLGLYRALASASSLTARELADKTGTHPRYIREWLEQQTVTGILQVVDARAHAEQRSFSLPVAYAEVLTDQDSPNYVVPLAPMIAGAVRPIDQLIQAFRSGEGVPYSQYGADFREGQGEINRVTFLQDLPNEWLPAIPDIHARLQAAPPARIADIGMGAGWSSIGMARAYPAVLVDGFDLDPPSVELARSNADRAGLNGRLNFHVRDAGDPDLQADYDLVTAFEAIHDMSDPIAALRSMRRLAGESGAVLVVDERVGDSFTAQGNDVEWMMYGWSILHCLPVGMSEQPSAGTGTVMRTDTLRAYARQAGFRDLEVLPIDNFFFRIYRLYP